MIDMTYDPEADAAYITLGKGKIAETAEAGPFVYDVDAEGRVIGIEILQASQVLAPGDWQEKARLPGSGRDGVRVRCIKDAMEARSALCPQSDHSLE